MPANLVSTPLNKSLIHRETVHVFPRTEMESERLKTLGEGRLAEGYKP